MPVTKWEEGSGVPYDGFFNGNVKLMMINGTFADYRPALQLRAELGKLAVTGDQKKRVADSFLKLEEWDKEWEAIAVEERARRRAEFIEEIRPRFITEQTVKGPKQRIWSTPSDNNLARLERKKKGISKKLKAPSGSIINFDPIPA